MLKNYDWGNWLKGIWAGFIAGGASAVVAAVTVIPQDPKDYNLGTYHLYVLIFRLFGVSGLIGALMYLRQHPTPDKKTTVKTVETVTQQQHPSAVVKTTVEETTETTTKAELPEK